MAYFSKIKFQKTYKDLHNAKEKHTIYIFYTEKAEVDDLLK